MLLFSHVGIRKFFGEVTFRSPSISQTPPRTWRNPCSNPFDWNVLTKKMFLRLFLLCSVHSVEVYSCVALLFALIFRFSPPKVADCFEAHTSEFISCVLNATLCKAMHKKSYVEAANWQSRRLICFSLLDVANTLEDSQQLYFTHRLQSVAFTVWFFSIEHMGIFRGKLIIRFTFSGTVSSSKISKLQISLARRSTVRAFSGKANSLLSWWAAIKEGDSESQAIESEKSGFKTTEQKTSNVCFEVNYYTWLCAYLILLAHAAVRNPRSMDSFVFAPATCQAAVVSKRCRIQQSASEDECKCIPKNRTFIRKAGLIYANDIISFSHSGFLVFLCSSHLFRWLAFDI